MRKLNCSRQHLKNADSILNLCGKIQLFVDEADSMAYDLTHKLIAPGAGSRGDFDPLVKELHDHAKFVCRFENYKRQVSSVAINGLDRKLLGVQNIENVHVSDLHDKIVAHKKSLTECGNAIIKSYTDALNQQS